MRVALLFHGGTAPPAEEVAGELREQLRGFGVEVDPIEDEAEPASAEEWRDVARRVSEDRPGILFLIGWTCGERECTLRVIETRGLGSAEIPVPDAGEETAIGLASAAREVVLGGLSDELFRLVEEGASPSPPPVPPAPPSEEPPEERPEDEPEGGGGLMLWLEGGYHGDYPYPDGQALNGAWIGVALVVHEYLVPYVSVGWEGVRRGESTAGEVSLHALPIAVAMRIAIPVGDAAFSISPLARLDVTFSTADSAGGGESSSVDVEIHVGGLVAWHLPISEDLEVMAGAGVAATVLGQEYRAVDEVAIPESKLRILWTAGLAWSPGPL